MKNTKVESAKAILTAIEIEKNANIAEALSVTRDLDITIADVLSVIDEECITWLNMDAEEVDENWHDFIYNRGYKPTDKVRLIDEYNENLFNVYLENRKPLATDAERLIDKLEQIKKYIVDDVKELCYCEMVTSHELIKFMAEAMAIANEISDKIEQLD